MTPERATVTVPDVRRDQMLRAAAELIGERGFSETRIADVARRSGASPALVIYYFGTKDQLLTEALRYSEDSFYSSVAAQLAAMPTAPARLELLVQLTCISQGDGEIPGAWGLWFDLWAQADADVDTFTLTFAALLDGLSIQVALEDPSVDSARALELAMGYTARELGFDWSPTTRRRTSRVRG